MTGAASPGCPADTIISVVTVNAPDRYAAAAAARAVVLNAFKRQDLFIQPGSRRRGVSACLVRRTALAGQAREVNVKFTKGAKGVSTNAAASLTQRAADWRREGHSIFVHPSIRVNGDKLATEIEAVERAGWHFELSLAAGQYVGTSMTLYLLFRAA